MVNEMKSIGYQANVPFDQILFEELAVDFLMNDASGDHLEPYFNGRRIVDITPEVIGGYVVHRLSEGASSMVIEAELNALRNLFAAAVKASPPKVIEAPYVPSMPEIELYVLNGQKAGID